VWYFCLQYSHYALFTFQQKNSCCFPVDMIKWDFSYFLKKLHLTVLWIVVDTLYNLATQIIKFNGFHYSQRTVQAKECLHHPKKNPSSCLVSVILVPPLSSSYQWQWLVSFLSLCRAILLISYEWKHTITFFVTRFFYLL
jgi:hypothetical protein